MLVPSLVLAWIFTHALQNVLFTSHTIILGISILVMGFQAFTWRSIWRFYFNRKIEHHLRSIAFYSYLMSLILTFMGIGSLVTETGHRKHEEYLHNQRLIKDELEFQKAGYIHYDAAEFPLGMRPVRNNETSLGESMIFQFRTSDDPALVSGFYHNLAARYEFRFIDGISKSNRDPTIIVFGEENHAYVLRNWRDGYWMVTIYLDVPDDFEERILRDVEILSIPNTGISDQMSKDAA